MKKINVGVVGATGVVGETFLRIMEERDFPAAEMRLFASENSQGLTRKFHDKNLPISTLKEGCFDGLNMVFFSSGDEISKTWAPKAVQAGAFAIDNSAAFRMNPEVALIVPEINGDLLPTPDKPAIIANPNCSTIQLVMAVNPLAKKYGLKSLRVATYQSVSGAGKAGIESLFSSTRLALEGEDEERSSVFTAPIAFNCVPQIGSFSDDGFCTEELKIMRETNKILRLPDVPVSAFTVRVPTLNGHAEAAWVTLNSVVENKTEIEQTLAQFRGVEVISAGKSPAFPTQKLASGRDPVYVGRVHRDLHDKNTWLMWIVSDNLRKGAALNGLQIAEHIFDIK